MSVTRCCDTSLMRSSPWRAMQRHSGGWGCLRPFFHWPNRVEGWYTLGHCCEDRDANTRGMNLSKSSMYKYQRKEVLKVFFHLLNQPFQPAFSTNFLNQPFWPTFSTHLLKQPSQTTFSNNFLKRPSQTTFSNNLLKQPSQTTFSVNKMRFILAIAAVLSALTITSATKVVCTEGLSGTNDCEKHYCLCNGNDLTCQDGTECHDFCVCAA